MHEAVRAAVFLKQVFRSGFKATFKTHIKNVDQGSGQGAKRFESGAYT